MSRADLEAILAKNARAPKQSPTSYFFEICVYKIQWMLCFYSRISGKFRNIIYSLLNLGSHWSQIQNYQLATRAHGESISCSERIPCCAADTVPSPTSSLESCWGTSTHVTLRSLLRPHRMFAICMKQRRGHCHDYRDVANFRSIKSNCKVFLWNKGNLQ